MQQSEMETGPVDGASSVNEAEQQQEAEQRQEWGNILNAASEAGELNPLMAAQSEQSAEPDIETKDLLAPLLGIGFNLLAPNWQITSHESEQLAESYALVLDKYFPGGLPMGPEVGAAMVTMAIFAPRVGIPRKLEPEPEPETEGGENEAKD